MVSQPAAPGVPRVEVYSRDGCHLCDQAIEVVRGVCDELGVGWGVRDIDADPELVVRYTDQVPVIMVDGRQVAIWRIDPHLLFEALGAD